MAELRKVKLEVLELQAEVAAERKAKEAAEAKLERQGKMTARELAEVKLYDLIQVPANKSKTEGVNRRTFAEVKRWTDFEARVRNLLQSLDDTDRCFTAPEDAAASPFAAVPAVADESPVHGAVFLHLGNIVNRLAEHLKLRVRFQTSGRVLSFCDGTARLDKETGAAALAGSVEVKHEGQLKLHAGEDIAAALVTAEGKGRLLPSFQQAFGDSVLEEAPVFMICTYNAAVFCKRLQAPSKHILVSPVVHCDGSGGIPLVGACLYYLQQAEELYEFKSKYQRELVPLSGRGYPFRHEHGHGLRSRKRAADEGDVRAMVRLRAHSRLRYEPGKSAEQPLTGQATALGEPLSWQNPGGASASEASPAATDHGEEDHDLETFMLEFAGQNLTEYSLADLDLDPSRAMHGRHGYTTKGKIGGRDVAIKVWNPAVRGAADAFKREAEVHNALKDQPHIPVWVACGYVAHSFCPFTATAWAGEPVPMQQGRVLPQHRTGVKAAIKALNEAGWQHGDLHPQNILLDGNGTVFLVDLGLAEKMVGCKEVRECEFL